VWAPFFLVPFFWPGIPSGHIAFDLSALAAGLAAAGISAMRCPPRPLPAVPWLILLLILAATAVHLADDRLHSAWFAWRQTFYFTAAWLVFAFMRPNARLVLGSGAWSALLAMIATLYIVFALLEVFDLRFLDGSRMFRIWTGHETFFSGPLRQRNMQSLFLVVVVVFLFRRMHLPSERAWIWSLAAAIPVCGLVLTASRSGAACLTLALALMLCSRTWRRHAVAPALASLILGSILSVYVLHMAHTMPAHAGAENLIEHVENGGIMPRLFIWDLSWQLFLQHPFAGVGWGNLPAHGMDGAILAVQAHPELAEIASSLPFAHVWSHNLVLQFLVEGGAMGGLAVTLMLLAVARRGAAIWRQRGSMADATVTAWMACVVMLLHGMASVALIQPFFMVMLALLLSAVFGDRAHA